MSSTIDQPEKTSVETTHAWSAPDLRLYLFGGVAITLFFGLLSAAAIEFWLGHSLSAIVLFGAEAAAIAWGYLVLREAGTAKGRSLGLSVLTALAWTFLAGVFARIAARVVDISSDGQWYHTDGIVTLRGGWNPISSVLAPSDWVNHWPKGTWIYGALLGHFGMGVEAEKSLHGLLFLATLLVVAVCLRQCLSVTLPQSLAIGAAAAFNPVLMAQAFSKYLDGDLVCVLSILAALSAVLVMNRGGRLSTWLLWAATIVVAANVKTTGFVYSGMEVAFCVAALCVISWRRKERLAQVVALRFCGVALAAFLYGLVFVGWNPYVTNVMRLKMLLYPAGAVGNALEVPERPPGYDNFNSFERFVISLAAYPSNDRAQSGPTPHPEWIWQAHKARPSFLLEQYAHVDLRLGGFGPLWPLLFVGSLGVALYGVWRRRAGAVPVLCIVLAVWASGLAIGDSYWARFVPQLWLIPVVGAVYLMIGDSLASKRLAYLLVGAMALDGLLMLAVNGHNSHKRGKQMMAFVAGIKDRANQEEVYVHFGGNSNYRERFKEAGIPFHEVTDDQAMALAADKSRNGALGPFPTPWSDGEVVLTPKGSPKS